MKTLESYKPSLSAHFTLRNIFFQVLTPIMMMIFIALYGVIDGIFVSNFDSEIAFAGMNLIFPLIMIVGGLSYMFGSGGSALVGKLLGEQKRKEANEVFSIVVIVNLLVGIVISIGGFFLVRPITNLMASITPDTTDEMVECAVRYGRILVSAQFLYMTQSVFQNFFVVDEKQSLGFLFTLLAGMTNIIFDAILVAGFRLGLTGAAVATILGYMAGSIGPLLYFLHNKSGLITLVKTPFRIRPIIKCITNGFSDFVFNVSASIISVVFNLVLLKYFGQNGISAYGMTLYLSFIFISVFVGFQIGIAPVIAYNYGAKNHKELQNVIRKSFLIIGAISLVGMFFSGAFAELLARLFINDNEMLVKMAAHSLRVYSLSYLMCGFSIFITSMFTALNNGLVSGLISIVRTFLLQIICVMVLPLIFGREAIWWAATIAELFAIIVALLFFYHNKAKYCY